MAAAAACADPAAAAIERGDRKLAEGEAEAAIAEYRLALRQGGESTEASLRLAHAYAAAGEVDAAVRHYASLLERDSSYLWQAAADLAAVARRALERGAAESMVRALEPIVKVRIGLVPPDLRLALARHHAGGGDHDRALPLYLSVVAGEGEAVAGPSDGEAAGPVPPPVFYEVGRSYEELGACAEAIGWFRRYLAEAGRSAAEASSARWHLGHCLFRAAEEERAAGRPRRALERLDALVELGVPQTVLDRAHYLRGELLLGLGEPARALDAYQEVLRLNPSRTGYLVRRAEERIRDIRFGLREP